MSAVLILAMPADEARVRNVTGALSESGVDVFWDRTIVGAANRREARERLDEARCVIMFWSAAVVGDDARPYLALARKAFAEDKLIAVRLEGGTTPAGLESTTTYDLRGWRSRASSIFMLDLISGAQAKIAGLDPPLPRAPRQLLVKRLAVLVPSVIAAAALLIGLYRDIGIDRIPSREEAVAWSKLRPGSCVDLRAFVSAYPDGVQAPSAQALLDGRRDIHDVAWERVVRPLDLYAPSASAAPARNIGSAHEAAMIRAETIARRKCETLAAAGHARLQRAAVITPTYDCEPLSGGLVCAVDATAQCTLEEPADTLREICGSKD